MPNRRSLLYGLLASTTLQSVDAICPLSIPETFTNVGKYKPLTEKDIAEIWEDYGRGEKFNTNIFFINDGNYLDV